MKKRIVRWDKPEMIYFKDAIRYIRKDSDQNADRVKHEILLKIEDLSIRPHIHPPDKYKQNNSGAYRAFELHRYRIAYLVKEEEVIIVRVRHSSQEPKEY
jgi:plasmid stabilization system protein ParE